LRRSDFASKQRSSWCETKSCGNWERNYASKIEKGGDWSGERTRTLQMTEADQDPGVGVLARKRGVGREVDLRAGREGRDREVERVVGGGRGGVVAGVRVKVRAGAGGGRGRGKTRRQDEIHQGKN